MPRVLIIDDDRDLLNVCTVGLEAFGYEVLTAGNGHDGLAEAAVRAPDLIVLDLGLPDMDGIEVCRRIRTWSEVPVVVLSADGTEDRKVGALGDGADDYMTKPFSMRELNARLQVALRHRAAPADEQPSSLDVGPLHLDLVHYEAVLDGRGLDLTPKEFDFLAYLARNAGKVCTRRMILESVWGPQYADETHYLKVYAYRIRRKLRDEDGRFLQSDPSVGYRLIPPGD
ncbi:MAG TPA: response regulator transcription factor [Trebonia sp.]